MDLASGTMIGGRYRLDRLLGRGGMGEVWAATHAVTRRDVALKFLHMDDGTMPQMRRRFLREARAAAAVDHPNVIRIQDVFELDDQTPVMVMDLLVGEALGDRLARERALPVADAAQILAPVVSAVGSAHALGIVHRDLKPENIFLARGAEGETEVKVLDFGIAKLGGAVEMAETGNITGTGAVLGTPYYMALEQAYGEKDVDHRADIWSLGVILYECLSGARPVAGDNFGQIIKHLTQDTIPPLVEVAPHVPEDLSAIVARMLRRDRQDRPEDLREVLAVLRRYTRAPVRTFGGPRAPQTSGTHDAPDIVHIDADRTHVLDDTHADSSPPRRDGRASDPSAVPPSSKKGRAQRVSAGRKVPPADVTLAEGAALTAPPRPATHRTALIAVTGAFGGIAVTVVALLALKPGSGPNVASAAPPATATVTASATAPAAEVSALPVAPAPPTPANPSSVPTAEPAASAATAGSAHRPHTGSAKAPPKTSATPATPVAPPAKRNGGLVDDPPF